MISAVIFQRLGPGWLFAISKWDSTERTLLPTKSQSFQGFISPWWQLSWDSRLNQEQGTKSCYILTYAHATLCTPVLAAITVSDNRRCFAAQGKYQASLSIWRKHLQDTLYPTGKQKAIFPPQSKHSFNLSLMYKLSKYILLLNRQDLVESHRYAWKIAMCHLYAERWSSNDSVSETQKHPQAHRMVSIISHYLGYWTKRVDTALQEMFCNELEILLHAFPQTLPGPVSQIIPFLKQAQTHHHAAMAVTGMPWDACWRERHSRLPPTASEKMWKWKKPL